MSVGLAGALPQIGDFADAAMRLHVDGLLKALVVPDGDRDTGTPAAIVERNPPDWLLVPERLRHIQIDAVLPCSTWVKPDDWS